MTRTTVNFLLDCALGTIFLSIMFSPSCCDSCFHPPRAPRNGRCGEPRTDDWAQFEFAILCLFTLAVLVHIMLHWTWVCGVVSNRLTEWRNQPMGIDEASRTVYGVGLLIVVVNVIGVSIAVAALTIQAPPY